MGTITYSIPISGQPNSTEDPKIASALTTLLSFANGGIDKGNLNPSASGIATSVSTTGFIINCGNTSVNGNGSANIGVQVGHGLGKPPRYVQIMPALATGGLAWTAMFGQFQSADSSLFYMSFVLPPNSGTFSVGTTYFYNWLALA